ncbi:MAG: hypothetical protein RRC34_08905 [Lentisphaeria bacterium]|nr:hypothetical protein [Lentisphaeria bacterium]
MPAPRQPELIQPEHLIPRLKWEQLFSFLPQWPEKKTVHYFWGYRHHALVDLEAELPLWVFTVNQEPGTAAEI